MKSKGFLISLDAFLSLTINMLLILMAFFYLSQVSTTSWNSVDLKLIVMDQIAVLEKSGILENAVKQGSSESILSGLNMTPYSLCFEVLVFNGENLSVPVIHAVKAGCQKSFTELSAVEGAFVVVDNSDVNFLVARVSGWKK
ncbi:MAG: hypothetical protein NTZ73_02910 [Candidatus Diapherotrites archaeon]|nr:hypothetical protein [Candidatus Diapherotrites archaeon]